MTKLLRNAFIPTSFLKIAYIFLTTSFFLLASCSSPKPSNHQLRIAFTHYPVTADPRASGDLISASLIALLYEGLMRCAPGNTYEFGLARAVEVSEDQLTYFFHLRPSVWSDGIPVTAMDFERSWKRILDPSFPAPCPYLFFPIKNGERAYKRECSQEDIGVRAIDELTLQVILERPTPYFLSLTAFPSFFPVPSHVEPQQGQWEHELITNGPFLLREAKLQTHLILQKNVCFWNAEAIQLDEIKIQVIDCEQTALRMFQRGDLDLVGGMTSPLPLDALERLRSQLYFAPVPATTFCAFQMEHPLLQNKKLRKALSYAIDRKAIVQHITQMGEVAATRCLPPTLVYNEREFYPPFDAQQAQELFQEALHELQQKDLSLALSYSANELNRKLATTLQAQWKEILGLEVRLDPCEKQFFRTRIARREYEIALHFWVAQVRDPMNILERFQDHSNIKNIPGWVQPHYVALLHQAIQEQEIFAKQKWLEQAEALLCEEMPLAPIYHWSSGWIAHPSLTDVTVNESGFVLFERIKKLNNRPLA
jgi:oligopeptide transport system substrate-binding protein